MSTRDNAPPPADWSPEPRTCTLEDHRCDGCEPRVEVEPDVLLGEN